MQGKILGEAMREELIIDVDQLIHSGGGRRFTIPGGICTIKASGEDTGGAYAMIEMLIPPQSGPPPHIHSREIESFYNSRGLPFFLAVRPQTHRFGGLSGHSSAGAFPCI